MKNALVVLAILCLPVFLSFSKVGGEKFTGEWKAINRNSAINSIEIKQGGGLYTLTYHSGEGGRQWSTSTYKYKDGSLIAVGSSGTIEFMEPSGHLKWNGDEWEKSSGKMK